MKVAKMPNGIPEIYNAIQGEGATQGLPMIFVRLSMCNLACKWCDSYYTWYFKGDKRPHDSAKPVKREEYQMNMTPAEVASWINKAQKGQRHKNVVFTGGEPLLQQQDILKVISELEKDGEKWYYEIETNGTLKLSDDLARKLNQVNSSPKLASSGNSKALRYKPETIKSFVQGYLNMNFDLCFKFVVMMEHWKEDLQEIEEWRESLGVPKELIYLMPEGVTRERIQEATLLLNDIASNYGYKVSTRIQILVYGDKRAV